MVRPKHSGDISYRAAQELHIIRDELDRSIDLMSDAGRQEPYRLQFLCRREFAAKAAQLGDIEHEATQILRTRHELAGSSPTHFGAVGARRQSGHKLEMSARALIESLPDFLV
jgi:hypothetical protein